MSRLGWIILAVIVIAAGAFLSLVSFGSGSSGIRERVRQAVPLGRAAVSPGPGGLVIPVAGYPEGALRDSWGDARGGGTRAHHGTDLMAARGTPVIAAAAGTIEKLFQSGDGGTTLYVRSLDGRWSYYYAHLAAYAAGMREGMRVRAGQPIGFVGDTGNAGAGNTHLHFGVSRMAAGDRWWSGEPVNPYPLLAGTPPRR